MPRFSRSTVVAAVVALSGSLAAGCSGGSGKPAATSPPPPTSASPSATPLHPAVATCPLTGLPPKPGDSIRRVALGVKIDNVDLARPQTGLDRADIVFEETVEGGLTRLFAIFQCSAAPKIGPIRSARTSDGDMLRLLDGAVFGFSGANPKALAPVAATSKAVLISYDALPQYYYRDNSRAAPHNVYSSTTRILQAGIARRHGLKAPPAMFVYGHPGYLGKPAKSMSIRWSSSASAGWTWNGNSAWARTQNGTPDVLTDGHRVLANNVVVMSITTRSTGLHDVLGNPSPDDVVTGSGKVWVLRDGRVIRGHWSRPTAAKPMTLRDNHGNVLKLRPGRTWVELLPRPRFPRIS
jgi:hypothetical protein